MRVPLQRMRGVPMRVEAVAWLAVAWLTLDVLPGGLYRRLLAPVRGSDENSSAAEKRTPWRNAEVCRIAAVVERMGRHMPFRCVCFHRGIAADRMLRRRGLPSTLHYGVARKDGSRSLQAHVWVSSDGQDVVGGSNKQDFREIATFPFGAMESLRSDVPR